MSRLTDINKCIVHYKKSYTDEEISNIIVKLGKLEDLEDELGCPLEVRCKVVTDSVIYDENGVEYKVVYTYMDYFDCENPFDNEMGYCDLCAFSWVDYKETWFLKKDKSE